MRSQRRSGLLGAASALVGLAAVGGCASNTGVLPIGPNTYTVTVRMAPIRGGGAEAEREALTQASGFCAQQGLSFVPSMLRESGDPRNPLGYSVIFRCLSPTDPAIARFNIQRSPNLVIENRLRVIPPANPFR